MRFYKIIGGNEEDCWANTQAVAHAMCKALCQKGQADWRDVEIHEVEVSTDKDSILELLCTGFPVSTIVRRFELTPRLGMKEAQE